MEYPAGVPDSHCFPQDSHQAFYLKEKHRYFVEVTSSPKCETSVFFLPC